MIGESSHSGGTEPQYEEIIQELSSLCFNHHHNNTDITAGAAGASSSSTDNSRHYHHHLTAGNEDDFFSGILGSQAFLQYSTWKTRRKSQREETSDDVEELLLLAKASTKACLERLSSSESTSRSKSLSIWTNPTYGTRALLTVIYHQLQLGEACYQQLDHVEIFLEQIIADFDFHEDSIGSYNVLTGLAGALQGVFFLRRELQRPDWAKKDVVRIAIQLLKQGQRLSSASETEIPLYWGDPTSSEIDWNISTGGPGILQTLLGLEMNEWNAIEKKIPNALESLLERSIQQLPSYGKMEYYSAADPNTAAIGWTLDGAAGHVILLLQAYVVLGSIDYLHQAQRLVKTVLCPRYVTCLSDLSQFQNEPLALFDGLIGVCYSLWLTKEREAARKLTGVAIRNCQARIEASDASLDVSLARGVAGLVRLLQQLDSCHYGNGDEMEVPFLSSALFNFVLQKKKPLLDSDHERGPAARRTKKFKKFSSVPAGMAKTSLSSAEDSGHYVVSTLPQSSKSKRRASISDLDEDSHMSVSSFSVDEIQGLNSAPTYQKKESRFTSMALKKGGMSRSVSSSSYSLKDSVREEEEDDSTNERIVLSSLLGQDDGSADSSSFSTSSHMENATVEDQADPNYLAKQDSDNEEYAYANKSVSLLPGVDDVGSDLDSSKESKPPRAPPIDRLALFATTRRKPGLLNVDSDSDSIGDRPPEVNQETPSMSNRKSLGPRGKARSKVSYDSSDDEDYAPSKPNRSVPMRRGPGMLQKQKAVKRNSLLGQNSRGAKPRKSLDTEGHLPDRSAASAPSTGPPSMEHDEDECNDDGLAIGQPTEEASEAFLAGQDISTRTRTSDPYPNYTPVSTQRKTLMDEEGHRDAAALGRPKSWRDITEGEESGSESMDDDEEEFNDDDGLAIGLPTEQADEAFLDAQDISTRTRTVDPYRIYTPVSSQRKTLMDEEGHRTSVASAHLLPGKSNLVEGRDESGSESMDDDDGEFNDDDGLAIGLPTEQADDTFLDAQDVSTRTRSVDPYPNYTPVAAQKKTLMDEEGHRQSISIAESNVIEEGEDSGSESMDDDDEEFKDDLAIGLPTEQADETFLDAQDVSTRTRSVDPYPNYTPVSAQRKTLMDEEGHRPIIGVAESNVIEEGEDSGSESMHDDDEEFKDGLAIGLPTEQANEAYLDAQDISGRSRTVNPYSNYSPVSVQKKTLMDEEGHSHKTASNSSGLRQPDSNILEEGDGSGSESMDDDEDEFNDDDGLAVGLPNEQPSEAYLDTHDISGRTRTVDPYSNYKPVATQRKTLMDEEGHGRFLQYPARLPSSYVIEEGEDSGSESMDDEDEFNDDGLAIGLPNEQPNEEYLDTHDISGRTRTTFGPVTNERLGTSHRKTSIDQEQHRDALLHTNTQEFLSGDSLLQGSDIDDEPNSDYRPEQDSSNDTLYD
eukprot:scaffold7572_cov118-Cylindrotheca_fusiformis.AAC.3